MASDVLQKVIGANAIVNGSTIVSVGKKGTITNHKIPPAINNDYDILNQSGVLQDRFDDTGVYGGGAATSP